MPSFGFKKRFELFVADGSKPHTIRKFRATPMQIGQKAYLFSGFRTKACRRILDPVPNIVALKSIAIYPNGEVIIIDKPWLSIPERAAVAQRHVHFPGHSVYTLKPKQRDLLAWNDGFRHEHDPNQKDGCFELMKEYWQETHTFPFVGSLIYWQTLNKRVYNI